MSHSTRSKDSVSSQALRVAQVPALAERSPMRLQRERDQLDQIRFVVDDQYARVGHRGLMLNHSSQRPGSVNTSRKRLPPPARRFMQQRGAIGLRQFARQEQAEARARAAPW